MRILYVASDQVVPGRTGGSVHVLEVSRGLAARGHEVHAVVHKTPGSPAREDRGNLHFHRIRWFPPHRFFRFRARKEVERLASQVAPEAIMERYYNFGGEGIAVAAARSIPCLLEVNSPILDHPGSWKGRLDALALLRPMRRYREALCHKATALVVPIPGIVPPDAREKTEIVTWGANVDAFRPEIRSEEVRKSLGIPPGAVVCLFSGSFRPWHGVRVFEEAARRLLPRVDLFFLLVGGGRPGTGRGFRGRYLGRAAYEAMPGIVAAADIGIAPYDTSRLAQLRLGFYWSPLKIFEYMASGLPTLTIPRPPLTEIVREGLEGLHFSEGDPGDLALKILSLAQDATLRERLGARARERAVRLYSWTRHCEQLEGILRRIAC